MELSAEQSSRVPEANIRLADRASTINLIHEALRLTTLDLDRLYRLIARVLIIRRAMGFSRVILLRWDEKERGFRGYTALGAPNRDVHNRVQGEIDEMWKELETDRESPDNADRHQNEEALFSQDPRDLHHENFWLRVRDLFERHEYPLPDMDRMFIGVSLGPDRSIQGNDFIDDLFRCSRCLKIEPGRMADLDLPDDLKRLLTGESLWAGIRTRKGPCVILIVDKIYEEGSIQTIDELYLNWLCAQLSLAVDNGQLFSDLKRSNEELRAVDMLKSNFLSTISHELRSPMTSITGFVKILVDGKVGALSDEQHDLLARVYKHAGRLSDLVNDLIEIAEIDAGSATDLDLESVDAVEVLTRILPKLRPRMITKKVSVEMVTGDEVPLIRANAKALARIFFHLIDNAMKFSHERREVRVEFESVENELRIRIVDTGIGIKPERCKLIFDAFYQIDNQLARVYEGMGIGLTLTQKLITQTGGRIEVRSVLDEGSTFTVIYPHE